MIGRLTLAVSIGAAIGAPQNAHAGTLRTLHNFCARPACADGNEALAKLLRGPDGTFYGTTFLGGSSDRGVVFALVPDGTKFQFQVLHSFCRKTNCTDGAFSESSLIVDTSGNLYGTTDAGGLNDQGTAFELIPNADHSRWTAQVLYSFCAQSNCVDGAVPYLTLTYKGAATGALYDGTSPLFGATSQGGTFSRGTAYELIFVAGKTKRKEKVLYSFCAQSNCTDGDTPTGIVADGKGNLFGATRLGGNSNQGTAFELVAKTFDETVLHHFCSRANCKDGAQPFGAITLNANGRVFGSTQSGGDFGKGTVFRVTPNGTSSQEAVLHSFCAETNCTDGQVPNSGVTIGANGVMFGTTQEGGATGLNTGILFRLVGTTFTALYSFCSEGGCTDGASPQGVIIDPAGRLFGVTDTLGAFDGGTVFRFTP
jgi:uncharacterized repeat protein (TIGR03803 family)